MLQVEETAEPNNVRLSKKLTCLLRHGAVQEGLPIQPDGFVEVIAILQNKKFNKDFTLDILKCIVASDEKQRYAIRKNAVTGKYEIRANQGYSLDIVKSDQCLVKINDSTAIPLAIHGTYYQFWPQIKQNGLRRMTRNHIHFATTDKMENRYDKHKSALHRDYQILIYLDVQKAMKDGGLEFYKSENNVILCAGKNGYITKEYFSKVVDKRTGAHLKY